MFILVETSITLGYICNFIHKTGQEIDPLFSVIYLDM